MTAGALPVDVVVFGGGVAGLWTKLHLDTAGYSTVLVESDALGAGQTRCAQGIIHGGIKYSLTGQLSDATRAIRNMPGYWRRCLAGDGDVDLRGVEVLASNQYLWSPGTLTGRVASFFASRMLRSAVEPVEALPEAFRALGMRGSLYRLDEPVLDVGSLVRRLRDLAGPAVHTGGGAGAVERLPGPDEGRFTLRLSGAAGRVDMEARSVVLAAGAGIDALAPRLGLEAPATQRRPLHMVLVRGVPGNGLYLHCMGAAPTPRLTVTTHRDERGRRVWYLGGQLAEEGVDRSPEEQRAAARREVSALFPGLEADACEWSTFRVDRAEPMETGGLRPDDARVEASGRAVFAWPTKLALAPRLAEQVEAALIEAGVTPGGGTRPAPAWSTASLADAPWDEERRWN